MKHHDQESEGSNEGSFVFEGDTLHEYQVDYRYRSYRALDGEDADGNRGQVRTFVEDEEITGVMNIATGEYLPLERIRKLPVWEKLELLLSEQTFG